MPLMVTIQVVSIGRLTAFYTPLVLKRNKKQLNDQRRLLDVVAVIAVAVVDVTL